MAKRRTALPYREGTWFAVPLRTHGYAVGVVARMDSRGGIFGYFFGPKRATVPTRSQIAELSVTDAVWSCLFGDLGLLNGEWTIICESDVWDRVSSPLPPFINVDRDSGKAVKVLLDDEFNLVAQQPCDPSLAKLYPEDGDFGYGAVEIRLTKLLS